MKLKALRPLKGSYGFVKDGEEFEATPATAQSLLDRGLAVKVKGDAPRTGKSKDENKGAKAPLAGSRTGGAKSPSSSRAGRASTK